MTRLEWCDSGEALRGAKLGMVSTSPLFQYDVFREYHGLKMKGHKEDKARQIAAENCKCSYSTVVRAIYFFEHRDGKRSEQREARAYFQILENAAVK